MSVVRPPLRDVLRSPIFIPCEGQYGPVAPSGFSFITRDGSYITRNGAYLIKAV